jgi:hypothetical protein
MKGGSMEDQRIFRRLSRWAIALSLTAIVAPAAQAHHAPAEANPSISPVGRNEAAMRHHHPDVVQPPTRVVTVAQADGFDWGDAGIGAGGALGAVLLVGGSVLLLKRESNRTLTARGT